MKIRFLDRLQNVRREGKVAKWYDALAPEITDGLVSKVINEWPGAAVSVPLSILAGNTRAAISAYGTNFSTLRSDSSGTVSFSNLFYNANKANATTFGIVRLVFDIDSLAGQQIESGSITLSKTASAINSDSAYLYAFTRDTAGTTGANDYDNFGVKLSDMATYNPDTESITFVLNAAGIAYINAGFISFMVRDWEDADNVIPSEQSNTFQSFSTFVTDFYKAAPLLDLTQSNPLYRPQFGYDKEGEYVSKIGISIVSTKVSEWANNADSTSRIFSSLTQANAAIRPDYDEINETVNFTDDDSLNISTPLIVLNQCTMVWHGYISSSVIVTSGQTTQFHLYRLPNIRLSATLSPNTSQYYIEAYLTTTSGLVLASTIMFNSLDAFKGAICDRFIFIAFKFLPTERAILLDNVRNQAQTHARSSITITSSNTACISGVASKNIFLKIKSIVFYSTALTTIELTRLYENRNLHPYILQKVGLMSNGGSGLSAVLLSNKTITSFTASCWLYLQNILPTASGIDQTLFTNVNVLGEAAVGFQFKIQQSPAGFCYFRFVVGNGSSLSILNSAELTRSSFILLFSNKWMKVQCMLENNGSTDSLSIAINGYRVAQANVAAGCFKTTENAILEMMSSSLYTANLGAGNKIFSPYIRTIALSAEEILREYQDDKIKYGF